MEFLYLIFLIIFGPPIAMICLSRKHQSFPIKFICWIIGSAPFVLLALICIWINRSYTPNLRMDDALIISACVLILALFALIISDKIRRKRFLIPFISLCLCFAIATGCFFAWQNYEDNIPEIGESLQLYTYDPENEENILARLDEPATLRLTENLPIIDGATAMFPVYAAFAAEVYPEEALNNPDWFSEEEQTDYLLCSTTGHAYKNLADGEVDIIFAAAPSNDQIEYAASLGQEFVFTPIGREGFVFFVNSENPVDDLTTEQLRGIYSGEITNWNELGSDLGKIRVFQREEGSGSQSMLVRFMGDTPLMEAPTENVSDGMLGIIEQVSDYKNYKNSIGYSFRFYSTEMVKNDQIKLLSINGIAPTAENIANGSYPIGGEFYAVTLASNDNPNVDAFIEWTLSEQGQELIEKTGYVPLN